MAEILIATCPPIGHVGPLLNVARRLVDRGDRVTFLTSERHAAKIFAAGAHPEPLPAEADYDDTSLDADLPGRAEISGVKRIDFDVTHLFVKTLAAQTGALDGLLAEGRFDAVLVDAFFFGILPILLRDRDARPPVLAYTSTPLFLSSRDTAPGGTGILPRSGRIGRLRNKVLNAVTHRVLLRSSHVAADAVLTGMGLPKLPVFLLDSAILADRLIVPTVEEFEYPRSDLPSHVRFVGAVTPPPAEHFDPPSWWSELDGDRPVVHVTQGTLDNADLSRLIEPTIAALADEDVVVVVSTGGRDISQIRIPLPANTFVAEYIPHDVLLPRVDVMVTNGGYGAVQRALIAGVPLIVAGNTEDKPEVAARVEWFGAGVNLRTGTPDTTAVRSAVRDVLTDAKYRRAAATLQAAYSRRDGVAEIASLVDELIAVHQLDARHA
jgi:MGT family glycosyltransferase